MRTTAAALLTAGALFATLPLVAEEREKSDGAAPALPVDSLAHAESWKPIWETTYDERVAADPVRDVARADVLVLPFPRPIDASDPPAWFPERAPTPRLVDSGDDLIARGSRAVTWRVVSRTAAHETYLRERVARYAEDDAKGLVKWLEKHSLLDCLLFEARQMMGGTGSRQRWFFGMWKKHAERLRPPVSFPLPVMGEWLATPAAHHRTTAHSYFALDLNRIVNGRVSRGGGARNSDYASWNQPVIAQGDGVVTGVSDTAADHAPGRADPRQVANSVTVDYGGVSVVYAHLKRGSIEVEKGERVISGHVLGRVGNSGMSTAPHLHIALLDAAGQSIPWRFTIEARTERGKRWKRQDGKPFREGYVGRNLPAYDRVPPRER